MSQLQTSGTSGDIGMAVFDRDKSKASVQPAYMGFMVAELGDIFGSKPHTGSMGFLCGVL